MECQICAHAFNQSSRAKVPCFACDVQACKTCVRTYLLTSRSLPRCMNCSTAFPQSYVVSHLNRSWVNDTLKAAIKEVLLASELARVPETQPAAEAEKNRRRLVKANDKHKAKIDDLMQQVRRHNDAIIANRYLMRGEVVPLRYLNDLARAEAGPVELERKKFLMACPNAECRGFLSTSYKCAICERFTCPDCLVVLTDKAAHVCVESDKLSAELIKKETRPCPTCGERIYKVSGCDQMFCTSRRGDAVCGTAFSWITGKVETGTIHNPHFYELQQRTGVVRNVGDVPCGGMPDVTPLLRVLLRVEPGPTENSLRARVRSIHQRLTEHAQDPVVPHGVNAYRQRVHQADTRNLRVQYILGDLSAAELRDAVFKHSRDHNRNLDMYHVMELMSVSGIEAFRELCEGVPTPADVVQCLAMTPTFGADFIRSVEARLATLDTIRGYCNDQLKQISITYTSTVHLFDGVYARFPKKFNIGDA